jgi:hypothetical protein
MLTHASCHNSRMNIHLMGQMDCRGWTTEIACRTCLPDGFWRHGFLGHRVRLSLHRIVPGGSSLPSAIPCSARFGLARSRPFSPKLRFTSSRRISRLHCEAIKQGEKYQRTKFETLGHARAIWAREGGGHGNRLRDGAPVRDGGKAARFGQVSG